MLRRPCAIAAACAPPQTSCRHRRGPARLPHHHRGHLPPPPPLPPPPSQEPVQQRHSGGEPAAGRVVECRVSRPTMRPPSKLLGAPAGQLPGAATGAPHVASTTTRPPPRPPAAAAVSAASTADRHCWADERRQTRRPSCRSTRPLPVESAPLSQGKAKPQTPQRGSQWRRDVRGSLERRRCSQCRRHRRCRDWQSQSVCRWKRPQAGTRVGLGGLATKTPGWR